MPRGVLTFFFFFEGFLAGLLPGFFPGFLLGGLLLGLLFGAFGFGAFGFGGLFGGLLPPPPPPLPPHPNTPFWTRSSLCWHTIPLIHRYSVETRAYTPGRVRCAQAYPHELSPTRTSSLPFESLPSRTSGPPESPEGNASGHKKVAWLRGKRKGTTGARPKIKKSSTRDALTLTAVPPRGETAQHALADFIVVRGEGVVIVAEVDVPRPPLALVVGDVIHLDLHQIVAPLVRGRRRGRVAPTQRDQLVPLPPRRSRIVVHPDGGRAPPPHRPLQLEHHEVVVHRHPAEPGVDPPPRGVDQLAPRRDLLGPREDLEGRLAVAAVRGGQDHVVGDEDAAAEEASVVHEGDRVGIAAAGGLRGARRCEGGGRRRTTTMRGETDRAGEGEGQFRKADAVAAARGGTLTRLPPMMRASIPPIGPRFDRWCSTPGVPVLLLDGPGAASPSPPRGASARSPPPPPPPRSSPSDDAAGSSRSSRSSVAREAIAVRRRAVILSFLVRGVDGSRFEGAGRQRSPRAARCAL